MVKGLISVAGGGLEEAILPRPQAAGLCNAPEFG